MKKALIILMNLNYKIYNSPNLTRMSHVKVGSGIDFATKDIAEMFKKVIGYWGEIIFYSSKSDSVFRKPINSDRINKIRFKAQISFKEGLVKIYNDYLENSCKL